MLFAPMNRFRLVVFRSVSIDLECDGALFEIPVSGVEI